MTESTRTKIIEAASAILTEEGAEGMTARAVCAAANVQAPTIYRIFSDMKGLLDAVVAYQFDTYLHSKTSMDWSADPVDDLRRGFNLHVAFGLDNPVAYSQMYGSVGAREESPAVKKASGILAALIQRVAQAGRLGLPEKLAAGVIHSAGRGVCLTLIDTPPAERDERLIEEAREGALRTVTGGGYHVPDTGEADTGPATGPGRAAITMRAVLPAIPHLTRAERQLMEEWLERILGGPQHDVLQRSSPPAAT
jgi:AcrR family transcriptional regulator